MRREIGNDPTIELAANRAAAAGILVAQANDLVLNRSIPQAIVAYQRVIDLFPIRHTGANGTPAPETSAENQNLLFSQNPCSLFRSRSVSRFLLASAFLRALIAWTGNGWAEPRSEDTLATMRLLPVSRFAGGDGDEYNQALKTSQCSETNTRTTPQKEIHWMKNQSPSAIVWELATKHMQSSR